MWRSYDRSTLITPFHTQRRMQHQAFRVRRAAMDTLVSRVHRGKGKEAVIVLGAARFKGCGYQNFPMKQFVASARRQSVLILLDEHMTSQRCSSCGFKEIPEGEDYGFMRQGPSKNCHTLRCPETTCRFHVAVERDSSSARSIFRILFHLRVSCAACLIPR